MFVSWDEGNSLVQCGSLTVSARYFHAAMQVCPLSTHTRSAQEKSSLGAMSAHAQAAGAGPGAYAAGMMTGAEGEEGAKAAGELPAGHLLQVTAQ